MSRRAAFDVAIVGGGSAGVGAALGAARMGARTLLVERSSTPGGNVAQAFVHTICGLYEPADGDVPHLVNAGLCTRLPDQLIARGAARAPERAGRVWVLPISPPDYARSLADALAREANLEARFETRVVAATLSDVPHRLELRNAAGKAAVEAQIVIDTSGDGVLAALARVDAERADATTLQRPSYIVRLDGVANEALEGFSRVKITAAIAGAARDRSLPEGCESVLARPGRHGEAYVTINVPASDDRAFDPQDDTCRGELEVRARGYAEAVTELLRERYDAFRDARIGAWPERIGVREGTRLLGRAVIDADHILEARRSDDDVARSSWPIELWNDHRRAKLRHPTGVAGVPLAALVSRSHATLGMAGRCLSATHEALGALRVVGTALATGEAIGCAAAIAADSKRTLAEVEASEVRAAIRSHG